MQKALKGIAVLLSILLLFCGCAKSPDNGKLKITATNIACYDFARAVARDRADIRLLLPPGSDIHAFEPTVSDIVSINESDLFIYLGGESESWVSRVISSADNIHSLKMMDLEIIECHHDGHNHSEHSPDEHIWNSPDNAAMMLRAIANELSVIDAASGGIYKENAEAYIAEIMAESDAIKQLVADCSMRHIVVADRFPFQYFTEYFGLTHTAAFSGCDADNDADLATVIKLIEQVRSQKLGVIYVTEMSNRRLADTVSRQTGAVIIELHSYQNISPEDFSGGVTYLNVLARNRAALERGLY